MYSVLITYISLYSLGAVQLIHNGMAIMNDGFVNVDNIDEDDSALLCQTNKTNCCKISRYVPNLKIDENDP